MKLLLYREDLRDMYRDVNTSVTGFECFKPEIQALIRAAGRATFWNAAHTNYNVIVPPEPDALEVGADPVEGRSIASIKVWAYVEVHYGQDDPVDPEGYQDFGESVPLYGYERQTPLATLEYLESISTS